TMRKGPRFAVSAIFFSRIATGVYEPKSVSDLMCRNRASTAPLESMPYCMSTIQIGHAAEVQSIGHDTVNDRPRARTDFETLSQLVKHFLGFWVALLQVEACCRYADVQIGKRIGRLKIGKSAFERFRRWQVSAEAYRD